MAAPGRISPYGGSVSRNRGVGSWLGSRWKTVVVAIGLALGATAASSVASAAWTVTGTGTASGKAITLKQLTVAAQSAPAADLYPGHVGNAQFTVTNPNTYGVQLTSVTIGTVTSDKAGCPGTDVQPVATPVTLKVPVTVRAGQTQTFTVPALKMSPDAPDACQGATFTMRTAVTGTPVFPS
jgi:hypothetical protein